MFYSSALSLIYTLLLAGIHRKKKGEMRSLCNCWAAVGGLIKDPFGGRSLNSDPLLIN